MEDTITLQEIIQTIKKRIALIISISLAFLIIGAFITFFITTPKYQSSTQILINQSQNDEEISSADLQSSRELISTYNVIMTSPAILEPVQDEIDFEGTMDELRSKINVAAEEESQVATVTIEDTDPQRAVRIANTLSQTFEQQIPNIMDVDNVSVLSEAEVQNSTEPVSPRPLLNLAISLLIGLIVGIGTALIIDFLDKSIKTERDIEKELGIPILGVVPFISEQENKTSNTGQKANLRRESNRKTS